jgi:ABC-type sugar transport system permease subunit
MADKARALKDTTVTKRVQTRRFELFPYLLLAPYLVVFGLFLGYPILRALYISLFEWGIFGPVRFVGLENYTGLFGNDAFWRSLWNTLFYTILFVPSVVLISLLLAVLLKRNLPGMPLFRTAFFWPMVINVAVAAIAVQWILQPQFGMLNRFLTIANLPTQTWLNQPGWAMVAVAMVSIWTSSGFNIIIFLAGLENIPQELYDAAMVDGSNAWHNLLHITVPLLKPVTLLVTILSLVQALMVFGEVFVLTQGGPFGSTKVLTYLLYEQGFTYFRFGVAAAIGVVMTVMIAFISFAQFKLFREN